MSLFNQILDAINSPEREGNSNQLTNILETVQHLSNNHQTNPDAIQSALSIVGQHTRSALQNQRNTEGEQQVQQIIQNYGGTSPNSQVLQMLFNVPQLQQMVQEIARKTGINTGTVESMLPMLVPLVLNVLKTGSNTQNPQASNPVLSGFLDTDRDGDVDIADVMRMANQHLNR